MGAPYRHTLELTRTSQSSTRTSACLAGFVGELLSWTERWVLRILILCRELRLK